MAAYRSTLQLAEFLALLEKCGKPDDAVRAAVERTAEALDAEIAVALGPEIALSVGFGREEPSRAALDEVIAGTSRTLELPGMPPVIAIAVAVDHPAVEAIVLGRTVDAFLPEEIALAEGMTRALAIHLRHLLSLDAERRHGQENARLVALLEDRQRLLERLARTQRTLSRRAPLPDVLDAIADGAAVLLGVDIVGLRLVDLDDATHLVTVASAGISADDMQPIRRCSIDIGIGGRAFREERLVVVDDYAGSGDAIPNFAAGGMRIGMAAPVHDDGRIVGVLVVGSSHRTARFDTHEREAFLAYAENASLALSDVKLVETMQRSFIDGLTGLPNRSLFMDRLDSALASGLMDRSPIAVLVVALADFSAVNHSRGFTYGDRTLQAAAAMIEASALGHDVVARLAGDEFAVLLRATDLGAALNIAERIRSGLRDLTVDGESAALLARVGVAVTHTACEEPDELVSAAHRSARDAGRDLFAMA